MRRAGADWGMPLIPAALGLLVSLLGIRGPSYWLDEAATVSMVNRPLPDMLEVFGKLDLVHAVYYLVLHPWAGAFGTGELALRSPSALGTALAAAGVAVIGRRCVNPLTGLLAGLAYAGSVTVTRYGQEARAYALVAAAAVLATYLFLRAVERDGRRPWAWTAGYALGLLLLGLLNLYGVLLVAAHGITLLLTRSRARAPGFLEST